MVNFLSKKRFIVLSLAAVAALIVVFLLVGPHQLLAKSDSPGFCAGCHVMEKQHTAYMHSGAHRRIRCVDCHLPNENPAVHYIWKGIDGMKDAIHFYSGKVPEHIKLSVHGAEVLQANCIRCHEELVSMINTEKRCWNCHRSITHTRAGAIETL